MAALSILRSVTGSWWTFLLRGILSVLFGIAAFIWPGLTLFVLVVMWGVFALVDGIAAIVMGIRAGLWAITFFGVLGALAGGFALFRPDVAAVALLIVIAAWSITRGVFEIIAAIRLREEITNEWLLILMGALSILFGVLVVMTPAVGALAIVWLIGIEAIIVGLLLIVLSVRLKRLGGSIAHLGAPSQA